MFLRWKKQKIEPKDGAADMWLSAQIVESHRFNGKPRQKVIKVLGRIRESHLSQTWPRHFFWGDVEQNLSKMTLDEELCKKFRDRLSIFVKKPSYKEIDRAGEEERTGMSKIVEK
jgi:hypothetical protein